MSELVIVDFGMGNIHSVQSALLKYVPEVLVSSDSRTIQNAKALVLPGVGSFKQGMEGLKNHHLVEILNDQVLGEKKPIFGICLGMQLFSDMGFEGGECKGLGWIPGRVEKLRPQSPSERVPHVGWNEVTLVNPGSLFTDIPSGKDFYFAHSFHFICSDSRHEIARTPYCNGLSSIIRRNNIIGVQFHPEKSQTFGAMVIKLFLNFAGLLK